MKIKLFLKIFVLTFVVISCCDHTYALLTPKPVLKGGLVGYWSFDTPDMSGTVAYDKSGQGVNGTLKNITATSSVSNGKIGQGIRVGNSSGYISYGDVFDMGTNSMTLSLWVKSNALASGTHGLMNKSLLGNQNGRYFLAVDSGVFIGGFEGAGGQVTDSTSVTPYNDNKWHMVTQVFNRTGNMTLYVDGVNKSSASISSQSGSNMQTSDIFLIGKYNDGSGGETGALTVDATLDDARVYTRALSATEIATLYKETLGKINATSASTKINTGSNSPIAHWTFDGINMTNATATDITGNANNGALINMTTTANAIKGKIGQALRFDGTSSKVKASDAGFPSGTSPRTVSLWAKPRVVTGNYFVMFSYGTFAGNQTFGMGIDTSTNKYYVSQNGNSVAGNVAQPDVWTHLVATYDGSNYFLYENGVQTGTGSMTTNTVLGGTTTIGYQIGGTPYYFDGSIDDVRVYNRALSSSEVAKLYLAGGGKANVSPSKPISSGLVGYWNFDGKNMTNSTSTDSSGNGNNGTLTNMTTTANAIKGKLGQALNFVSASNQYVIAPDSSSLDITTNITISAWIKPDVLGGGYKTIVSKRDLSNTTNYQLYLNTTAGALSFYSGTENISSYIPPRNQWTFVSATVSGTTLTFYVNGVSVQSGTISGSVTPNNGSLYIGSNNIPEAFSGSIDDVRVYNRALSPSEMLKLYQMGGK